MIPQATQGCEATRTGGSGLCKASGTSQTSRAQPRKGVGRAKGVQSTSEGRRPPRIYGATLGQAGAPPKVGGWVMEEWKGGGFAPPIKHGVTVEKGGRQHETPTLYHDAQSRAVSSHPQIYRECGSVAIWIAYRKRRRNSNRTGTLSGID